LGDGSFGVPRTLAARTDDSLAAARMNAIPGNEFRRERDNGRRAYL
jgi:hypothetical protein